VGRIGTQAPCLPGDQSLIEKPKERSPVKEPISLLLVALMFSTTAAAQSGAATKALQPSQSNETAEIRELKIPAGTAVDIEVAYTVSSLDVRPNELISFRVVVPVQIDGITVIEKYSLVTGRVVQAKRGGHWGKAGKLAWIMEDVVAVDLTRVPLTVQAELPSRETEVKGTSHGGEVATKAIVLGALIFPLTPLALMSGFKRGENAVLPEGKRFRVFVGTDTTVKAATR
jgi:hypothetical protein